MRLAGTTGAHGRLRGRRSQRRLDLLIVALDRRDVLLPGHLAPRRAQPCRDYRSHAVSYLFAYELDSGP